MGQVLVREVADEAIDFFERRARVVGRTLEQELRELIERQATCMHIPFTPEEREEALRRMEARQAAPTPAMTLDEIREGLE